MNGTDTHGIERDLEHTRARLDATLDALQQKLSPGQMVDEAMNWFRQGDGAEFTRNFGRSVRDNPVPLALIGAGIGWLIINSGRSRERGRDDRWEDRYGYDADRARYASSGYGTTAYAGSEAGTLPDASMPYEAAAYEDLATRARDAGARVERQTDDTDDSYRERVYSAKASVLGVTRQAGEALSGFVERVEAALESAADRFRRMASQGTSRAGDAARQGRAGLQSLYGYGQSAAYGARDSAGQAAGRAREAGARTADYLKDQPLLMGVIGVTVGAVLGMLVPPTRYERELAGDLRRSLGDQARGAASDMGQRAMRVAEAVLDTAHDAARREGLTGTSPSGVAADAREKVSDVAGRARSVVEESLAAGREALDQEARGAANTSASAESTPGTSRSGEHGDRRPSA